MKRVIKTSKLTISFYISKFLKSCLKSYKNRLLNAFNLTLINLCKSLFIYLKFFEQRNTSAIFFDSIVINVSVIVTKNDIFILLHFCMLKINFQNSFVINLSRWNSFTIIYVNKTSKINSLFHRCVILFSDSENEDVLSRV